MNELCEQCGIELKVVFGGYGFEGDDSPDTPTMVYRDIVMECRNPNCTEYKKKIEHKVYLNQVEDGPVENSGTGEPIEDS